MTDAPRDPAAGGGQAGGEGSVGGTEPTTCYRHPQREAHVRCARCGRRICPDCMIPASVGFQCPECVREGNRGRREWRTQFGGRPSESPGSVTKVIIAVNVVVYLAQLALGSSFTNRLWLIAAARDPALGGEAVGVATGEVYRLLTAAFLHSPTRFFHILFNMYALWLFGPQLEAALGRARFVAVYLLSALGGTAASYAFSPLGTPSLGASGAVFGLFGAYLVVSRRLGRSAGGLWVLLGLNFVLGFVVAGIDWRAHVGGLLAGAATCAVLAYAPRARRTAVQALGCAVVLAGIALLVTARTLQLT